MYTYALFFKSTYSKMNIVFLIKTILYLFLFSKASAENDFERTESLLTCKFDVDCKENSFCFGNDGKNRGKCKCMENYVIIGRNRTHYECLAISNGLDSPCTKDVQCQVNMGTAAVCAETELLCKCGENAYPGLDGRCYKSIALGEICESNFNCRLADGSYGFCVVGKCTCNLNQHPSEDRQRCIQSVPLGKSCVTSESCIHTFANCYGGICQCVAGYIESSNNTVCLKAATEVGDSCVETTQCSAYISDSFCMMGNCSCKANHHGYGNECVPDALLGERCTDHKECILSKELMKSVKCSEGVCVCSVGVSDENSYGCVVVPNNAAHNTPIIFVIATVCLFYFKFY